MLKRLLNKLRRRPDFERELAEEMESHRAMAEARHIASGMSPAEARRAAARQLGNVTLAREDAREVWLLAPLEQLWRDLRYGARQLRRSPGFALVAVLVLGLGIGLNSSIFTVFNSLAWRSWSIKDPRQLVDIYAIRPNGRPRSFEYPIYAYHRQHSQSFSSLIASRSDAMLFGEGAGASRVRAFYVSGNYLPVLGAEIVYGRAFVEEEDVVGSPQAVAVIADRLWRARLGARPDVVGQTILLHGMKYRVVGVAAPGFTGTAPIAVDVWLPLAALPLADPRDNTLTSADTCCVDVSGRLKPGVSRERAQAELLVLHHQAQTQFKKEQHSILVTPASALSRPDRRQEATQIFALALGAVGLVLLIACANVANLLLARASARHQEFAVRLSIGASRGQVIRQLLTEGLILGLAGGALGLALAVYVPDLLVRQLSDEPLALRIAPDWAVLTYTLVVSILAATAFGLAPALQATRRDVGAGLKPDGGSLLGWRPSRLRGLLLGVQVATSCVLLVSAGLLLQGLRLGAVIDVGFTTEKIAVLSVDLRLHGYTAPRAAAYFEELIARASSLPGVISVASASTVPLGSRRTNYGLRPPGARPDAEFLRVSYSTVSRQFHATLGIPVVKGRTFDKSDAGALRVVVNETMAEQFWPGENPIGKILDAGGKREVIGVVRNISVEQIGKTGPQMYWPGFGTEDSQLLVRTSGELDALLASLPEIARSVDRNVRGSTVPLQDYRERQLGATRVAASIAGALGGLALALACVGIFGVVSYAVQQRTKEIGVRMALGASSREIVELVARQNLVSVAVGLVAGVLSGAAAAQLLGQFLYGLSFLDPAAYIGGVALLILSAALACLLPARRAMRVDPMTALRYE